MPQIATHIFNRKKLDSILKNVSVADLSGELNLQDIIKIIRNWHSLANRGVLDQKGEIQLQDSFLKGFFGRILQYKGMDESPDEWFYEREKTTAIDATRSDAALGFFTRESKDDVKVVVELKSAKTNLDQKQIRKGSNYTPVEQAFMYATKFGKACNWIIISNYIETRLYHSSSMHEYEVFLLENLDREEDLKKFLYLLCRKKLINKEAPSPTDKLYRENEVEQEQISKIFYDQYKEVRFHLFEHLKEKNPGQDEFILLEKTQKILDRFIFICFCEDTGLLPEHIFRKVLAAVKANGLMVKISAWEQIKGLFHSINEGSPAHNINRYDGGLFAFDEILDGSLVLDDEIIDELAAITNYDFESDLNVNILGHIFEQSISDIEEIKSAIASEPTDRKKGKRKKEGIYYTPEYITRYIVEQAVGGCLNDQREGLGFSALPELTEKDYDSVKALIMKSAIRYNKNIRKHLEFWGAYKEVLSNIKILDPACGSGAFLNQAFDYLYREGQYVNRRIAELQKGQMDIFGLDKHILKNNLFGVDLNRESVEITKLSLWLKTANPKSTLTALDDNIRCGNSLIDDPEVVGDRAFDWDKNFPEIMKNGGFDVVIGNPPYGILIRENEFDFFRKNFPLTQYKVNLYVLFIERMFQIFTKGIIHFIIPKSLLFNTYFADLRKHLLNNSIVEEVLTIEDKVFADAEVGGSLLFKFRIQKNSNLKNKVKLLAVKNIDASSYGNLVFNEVSQESFLSNNNCEISITTSDTQSLMEKLKGLKPIKNFYNLRNGLNPGNIKHILISDKKDSAYHKPIIWGKDINKYNIRWSGDYVLYDEKIGERITIEDTKSKPGMKEQKKIDYALRTPDIFETIKIVIRKTGDSLIAGYDENNYYFDTLVHGIYQKDSKNDLLFLLALINSKPATFFYRILHNIKGKVFAKISLDNLKNFPIPDLNEDEQGPLINNAKKMIGLNNRFFNETDKFIRFFESKYNPKTTSKKLKEFYTLEYSEFLKEQKKQKANLSIKDEFELMAIFNKEKETAMHLKSQIEKTDYEIDQMVYDIYGLNEDEIKLVENS